MKDILNTPNFKERVSPNKAFEGYCKQEQEHSNDLGNMLSLARCYHLGIGTIKNDYILYLVIIAMRCYYLGKKDGPGLLVFYYSFGWVIAFFCGAFSIPFLFCSILSFLAALISFMAAGGEDWL